MTLGILEKALGEGLRASKQRGARKACSCHITCDIGAYDTCSHFCRYCYANTSREAVLRNASARSSSCSSSAISSPGISSAKLIRKAGGKVWP